MRTTCAADSAEPELQPIRRSERTASPAPPPSGPRVGLVESIWQPFTKLGAQQQRLWIACMWEGRSVIDAAHGESLATDIARAQLLRAARQLDAWRDQVRHAPARPPAREHVRTENLFAEAVARKILSDQRRALDQRHGVASPR